MISNNKDYNNICTGLLFKGTHTHMSINVRNGDMHYLPHGTHEDTQEPSQCVLCVLRCIPLNSYNFLIDDVQEIFFLKVCFCTSDYLNELKNHLNFVHRLVGKLRILH